MMEPDDTVDRRVWKFKIHALDGVNDVLMPEAAKCVLFDVQDAKFHAWFEVNPDSPTVERRLYVVGTGSPVPQFARHLASFQVKAGDNFVWHLYEGSQS